MTASAEPPALGLNSATPLDAAWRARAEQAQDRVLPRGSAVVTCSAPIGVGGLGRHLLEIFDALERRGEPARHICASDRATGERASRLALARADPTSLLAALPIPLSPGLRTRAFTVEFDNYAVPRLASAEHLIAFNGQAVAQIRAARAAGYSSVSLVSANSHLRRVARQHALARAQYPLEGSWATQLLRRNLTEYAAVDHIYVASRYTRDSFIEQGFAEERLKMFQFTPDPRYRPAPAPNRAETFNIVYVGSLSVPKGVPLLIDAFRRLAQPDLRLRLVGGWASRGMRRFIERACAQDTRISHGPGDPLPHLQSAALCVHPTYEDGFAYAPAEAMACGVPVIVSEDTGMKELIEDPREGLVVPTGDLGALSEAIAAAYRREIFGG
ncbi:MAG: glycosyltransferase family 4 protein [Solirubrobacterales bacterium]|nr:glycosyltransferase family 4 protein [Solirubrobacterales bacterium]